MDSRIWNAICKGVDRRTQEQQKRKEIFKKLKEALVPYVMDEISYSAYKGYETITIGWPVGFDPYAQGALLTPSDFREAMDEEFPDLYFVRESPVANQMPDQVYTWVKSK